MQAAQVTTKMARNTEGEFWPPSQILAGFSRRVIRWRVAQALQRAASDRLPEHSLPDRREAAGGGGNLGIMFDPLPAVAGEDYFIGHQNVAGLGLNLVDFAVSLPAPDFKPAPGIEFLSGWYTGANFQPFTPHSFDTPAGFAAPILRFHGVPEPSTWTLAFVSALLGMSPRRGRPLR
jgi:hypothetical protein